MDEDVLYVSCVTSTSGICREVSQKNCDVI